METLNELKVAAFRNAIKLFRDACLLAEHGRKETAYAIAVLAYEEIGKAALADRQLDRACLNPGAESFAREAMLDSLKNHSVKQAWAAWDTDSPSSEHLKSLNQKKNQALYVGYDGDKVSIPKVGEKELCELLREALRALKGLEDVPYYGVAGLSTEKSRWQAKADIQSLEHDLERVKCL